MEVLTIAMYVAGAAVIIWLVVIAIELIGMVLELLYIIFIELWPPILGIGCGSLLWYFGHDNWGAAIGIAGLIGQFFWGTRSNR